MTDRHCAYIITLEKPVREDDAEVIIQAIKMIKGVLTVEPCIDTWESMQARATAKQELGQKLWKVLYPEQ